MSDAELKAIRQRKFRDLQRRLANKRGKDEDVRANEVLNRIFKGRAWEVFNTAACQYPQVMDQVRNIFVKLASSGKLESVTGEQLYLFLRNMGLRVKLNTKINFASHGKLKPLAEKMKEGPARS